MKKLTENEVCEIAMHTDFGVKVVEVKNGEWEKEWDVDECGDWNEIDDYDGGDDYVEEELGKLEDGRYMWVGGDVCWDLNVVDEILEDVECYSSDILDFGGGSDIRYFYRIE